nr:Beta-lactamase CTX-M-4 precursor [Klebsiella pneumoniae]
MQRAFRLDCLLPGCGDKTGSGDYGTTNDIAVIWPKIVRR